MNCGKLVMLGTAGLVMSMPGTGATPADPARKRKNNNNNNNNNNNG